MEETFTWGSLIQRERKHNKDNSPFVYCNVTPFDMSMTREYNYGAHDEEEFSVRYYSEDFIYFSGEYDGMPFITSIPRNPPQEQEEEEQGDPINTDFVSFN